MRGIEVYVARVVSAVVLAGIVPTDAAWGHPRTSPAATTRDGATAPARRVDSLAVELRIQRLGSGSGSALVSSGVPFESGTLREADLTRLRVEVEGDEVSAYVAPLAKWGDGSLRSVLVKFFWDLCS